MSLKGRLGASFGATLLGPLVTTLVQFINIPIMLRVWGPTLYGEWLLLSAVPAYLLLADFGLGSVGGSDMALRASAGDKQGAINTFHSIFVMVMIFTASIGLTLSVTFFFLPMHKILKLSEISVGDARSTLFFLCLNCLVILQWGVLTAALRCAGKYALGMLCVNITRTLEGITVLVLLVWHAGPVELAVLMLVVSLVGTCGLLVLKTKFVPWLPLGVSGASVASIRRLWRPAIAYLAFPIGGAISTQGMTLMLGLVLGPLAVAVFNPMRTLSRLVYQLTDAVKNAVWQELSASFGQQNIQLSRKLHRTACQVSLLLAFAACIVLMITGKLIFGFWTHGRIIMDVPTFYFMLGVVFVNSLWNASSSVQMAANKPQRIAFTFLACTGFSLAVGFPLIKQWGLEGAAIALLIGEIGMSICVIPLSNRLLRDPWVNFAASMLDTTQLKLFAVSVMRRSRNWLANAR